MFSFLGSRFHWDAQIKINRINFSANKQNCNSVKSRLVEKSKISFFLGNKILKFKSVAGQFFLGKLILSKIKFFRNSSVESISGFADIYGILGYNLH